MGVEVGKVLYGTARHGTAWDSTVQHQTALHSTAQYSTAWHCIAQHSMAWHGTGLHSPAWHSTVKHCTAWHSTEQHCTVLHSTAWHGTVLHCMAQHSLAKHGTAQPTCLQCSQHHFLPLCDKMGCSAGGSRCSASSPVPIAHLRFVVLGSGSRDQAGACEPPPQRRMAQLHGGDAPALSPRRGNPAGLAWRSR